MEKTCCKCKKILPIINFGKLQKGPDGLRYDCNACRKVYREQNKDKIKQKQNKYYQDNKDDHLHKCKQYRKINADKINEQRKEYRSRPDVKKHIKEKNKEYLPIRKEKIKERRKTDINFKLSEILRSKLHKLLRGEKTSYQNVLGCDLPFLMRWIEFRFDKNMNWDNLGEYWQIDHILPIHAFAMTDNNISICFHWTNLQPLPANENRSKTNHLQLHYYFNNIVNINRFNKMYNNFLGYEAINKSLWWLRKTLRYRENPTDDDAMASEIGNQQPSL